MLIRRMVSVPSYPQFHQSFLEVPRCRAVPQWKERCLSHRSGIASCQDSCLLSTMSVKLKWAHKKCASILPAPSVCQMWAWSLSASACVCRCAWISWMVEGGRIDGVGCWRRLEIRFLCFLCSRVSVAVELLKQGQIGTKHQRLRCRRRFHLWHFPGQTEDYP